MKMKLLNDDNLCVKCLKKKLELSSDEYHELESMYKFRKRNNCGTIRFLIHRDEFQDWWEYILTSWHNYDDEYIIVESAKVGFGGIIIEPDGIIPNECPYKLEHLLLEDAPVVERRGDGIGIRT